MLVLVRALMDLLFVRRRFSVQRCARCHLGISASEMVMRARDLVYHLNCFTCTTCSKMLTTGDHFGMKDSLVYCRLHFETLVQGEYQTHFTHADVVPHKGLGPANALGLSYFNGVGSVQKGRPRKRKSPGPGAELAAYNAGKDERACVCVLFVAVFLPTANLTQKQENYSNLEDENLTRFKPSSDLDSAVSPFPAS